MTNETLDVIPNEREESCLPNTTTGIRFLAALEITEMVGWVERSDTYLSTSQQEGAAPHACKTTRAMLRPRIATIFRPVFALPDLGEPK